MRCPTLNNHSHPTSRHAGRKSPQTTRRMIAHISATAWLLLGVYSAVAAAAFSTAAPPGVRIAVVGAGAVGSYYGGRLHDSYDGPAGGSGTEVVFHLRGEHYGHCTAHGIDVESYDGDFRIPADRLRAFETTEEMAGGAAFDWVVCCLKSTSLDEVPELIEPLMSDDTRLLVIMNGLIEEDLIAKMRERQSSRGLGGVNAKAIYGGMALICSNRLSPGQISHTYGGKLGKCPRLCVSLLHTALTPLLH